MGSQAQAMCSTPRREPWNKGKRIGQKPPLRPKHLGRSVPDCRWTDRAIWQSILTLPPMLMVSFRAPRADYCKGA